MEEEGVLFSPLLSPVSLHTSLTLLPLHLPSRVRERERVRVVPTREGGLVTVVVVVGIGEMERKSDKSS